MPAIQLSSVDLNGTLKEGGRSVTGSGSGNRTRSALVIAEVALSLILLAGAGLLSATLLRLQRGRSRIRFHAMCSPRKRRLPESKYKTDAQQTAFYDLLLDKVRTIPGVIIAAGVSILPLSGNNMIIGFALEGEPRGDGVAPQHGEMLDVVTPDFFSAMKIPLKTGRLFTAHGGFDAARRHRQRGVREEILARTKPDRQADLRRLQQRLACAPSSASWATCVAHALDEEPAPAMYLPHRQAAYPG